MGLFSRAPNNPEVQKNDTEAPVVTIDSVHHHGLDYLVELVKQIRPKRYSNYKEAELRFKALFYQLQHDEKALLSLSKALMTQFHRTCFVPALTESGMVGSRGLLQEIATKVKHKVLPSLLKSDDFLYVINHVFYGHHDHVWVEKIDHQLWINFFTLLGIQLDVTDEHILRQLYNSLHILSQRTVTLGLEKEIKDNLPDGRYEEYPFYLLDKAVQNYLQLVERREGREAISDAIARIIQAVQGCKHAAEEISENRRKNGTSLSQTYMLFRIEQHLERILLVMDVLDADKHFNAERFLDCFIQVIRNEKKKNSIRDFISANFAFLAFKITEHGGTRGEKYITATRSDYWYMIKSAMGGGFIVSFTALIKNLITTLTLPPFWKGFTYSVNYALGFQMMHETHTTLATKQPAFTASALAGSLDYFKEYRKPDMYAVAITIARTIRSQLASFFGNLVIVFPLGYALAAFYHFFVGHPLLDGKEAHHMLEEQHPYLSLSIMYACFTGFFLFASGLIAGYVENGINYGNVGARLRNHPVFKNTLSSKRLQQVTKYVENNLGSLAGNVSLGFFLGMASFFGQIFGMPFDIRHITISAANSSIAFYTQNLTHAESLNFLLTVFGGVLLIGFFNFLVSFSLAFFVASKSRGVRLRDFPELLTVLGKFFIRFPLDFIIPPKYPREIDDVKRKFRFK